MVVLRFVLLCGLSKASLGVEASPQIRHRAENHSANQQRRRKKSFEEIPFTVKITLVHIIPVTTHPSETTKSKVQIRSKFVLGFRRILGKPESADHETSEARFFVYLLAGVGTSCSGCYPSNATTITCE